MPRTGTTPLLALVVVTAIWGYTFVPVQKAVAVYPLFAFLAVRFAISTVTLAPFALGPLRALPRAGWAAGLGAGTLLAAAYGLQTAGLELTTVTSTGFITGPLRRLHAADRARRLPDARARAGLDRRRALARRPPAPERRARRLVGRESARPRERRRAVAPDRRDGAVRAALRRPRADLPADERRVRRVHGRRRRGGPGRVAAGRADLVRARRHRRLRRARSATSSRRGCSRGRRRRARRSSSRSRRRSRRSSACSSSPRRSAGPAGPAAP